MIGDHDQFCCGSKICNCNTLTPTLFRGTLRPCMAFQYTASHIHRVQDPMDPQPEYGVATKSILHGNTNEQGLSHLS